MDPAPAELSTRLGALMKTRGLSERALGLRAGMSADSVRNLRRGLSKSPRRRTLEALARALDVGLADLIGAEAAAALSETPSPVPRAAGHAPQLEIPEFSLRPGSAPEIDDRRRWPVTAWTVPAALLEGRPMPEDTDQLVLVRAPSPFPADGIAEGDRLLVDISPAGRLPSPAGLLLLHDGVAHVLARVTLQPGTGRIRVATAAGEMEAAIDAVSIVGRVRGRWAWL